MSATGLLGVALDEFTGKSVDPCEGVVRSVMPVEDGGDELGLELDDSGTELLVDEDSLIVDVVDPSVVGVKVEDVVGAVVLVTHVVVLPSVVVTTIVVGGIVAWVVAG
jgi:hypothetical protein